MPYIQVEIDQEQYTTLRNMNNNSPYKLWLLSPTGGLPEFLFEQGILTSTPTEDWLGSPVYVIEHATEQEIKLGNIGKRYYLYMMME